MDVKTSFLDRKLYADVYMAKTKGCVYSKYPNRLSKLNRPIFGLKQASYNWNICLNEKVKEVGFLRNEDD